MKKSILNKALSAIVVICIIATAIPIGLIVNADGLTAPERKSSVGTIAEESITEGVTTTTIGSTYSSFKLNGTLPEATNTYKHNNNPNGVENGTTVMNQRNYNYLEFDLYVEDYTALKNSLTGKNTLMFNISYSTNHSLGNCAFQWIKLEDQITGDGWNHIVLYLGPVTDNQKGHSKNKSTSWGSPNRYYSIFVGTPENTNYNNNGGVVTATSSASTSGTTEGDTIALANVFLSNFVAPERKSAVGTIFEESVDGKVISTFIGDTYSSLKLNGTLPSSTYQANLVKPIVHRDVYDYLEFDVYIEDYDEFVNSLSYDANGNPLTKKNSLMFNLSRATNHAIGNAAYQWWYLEEQITHSGWNHIIINLFNDRAFSTQSPICRSPGWGQDNRYYSLFVGQTDGTEISVIDKTGVTTTATSTTKTKGDIIAMANVCLSKVVLPEDDKREYGLIAVMDDGFVEKTITIDNKGKTYTNQQYSQINGSTSAVQLNSVANCTEAEYIELDFFSELPKVLRDTFNADGVKWMFKLFDSNGKAAKIDFMEKLGVGWTHLVLPKTEFTAEEGFDWSKITSYKMVFEGTKLDTAFLQRHQEYGIANLNATSVNGLKVLLPETNCDTLLNMKFKFSPLGSSKDDTYDNASSNFTVKDLSPVDLSSSEFISFDLHISEKTKFDAMVSSGVTPVFWISSGNGIETASFGAEFAKYAKKNGDKGWWNYTIPVTEFKKINGDVDLKAINSCGIDFKADDGAKLGDYYDLELILANVGGIELKTPINSKFGEVVSELSSDKEILFVGSVDFPVVKNELNAEPLNANMLEMDIYISDYKSLSKDIDLGTKLKYTLVDANGGSISWDISEKICTTGWNHLILSASDGVINGFVNSTKITGWKLELVDMPAVATSENSIVVVYGVATTKAKTPEMSNKWDLVDTLFTDTEAGVLGNKFDDTLTKTGLEGLDFSTSNYVELDIYIQNIEYLKKAMKTAEVKDIVLTLNTADGNYIANITDKITENGWNHITVLLENMTKSGDSTIVSGGKLSFNGTIDNTNDARGLYWAAANVCATRVKSPELTSENTIVAKFDTLVNIGIYSDVNLTMSDSNSKSIDISNADLIEFDIYVPNSKQFRDTFALDKQGKATKKNICFGISSDKVYSTAKFAVWNDWSWQVRNDGWNHIQLSIKSTTNAAKKDELKTGVYSWKLYTSSNLEDKDGFEGLECMIANFAAVQMKSPELPANVLEKIGDTSSGAALGEYCHYTQDRIYQECFEPINVADALAIEFDIYINGYEELKKAQENVNNVEVIGLSLSSTYKSVWGQYAKPKFQFNSFASITDQITHNGWNHIRVGLSDFVEKKNGGVDFSGITSWTLTFTNASNVHPNFNSASGVFAYVTNLVATGYRVNIPEDSVQSVNTDKSAVYISSCETEVDDYGAWNSGEINTINKTEGTGSMKIGVSYTSDVLDTQLIYVFDETVDMTDLKELKFDLLIDFIQFAGKSGNKAEIILSMDRKGNENYYSFPIGFNNIKTGWNEFSIKLESANKIGNADLSSVKAVIFRFTELDLNAEDFERFTISLDNLRYLSKNGSTKLKINTDDVAVEDLENNDFSDDSDFEINDIVDDNIDTNESKPQEIIRKVTNNVVKIDYVTAGIIIGVVAAVLAVGFVVFVLVYRKKRRF